jgi:hypothetical protein
VVPGIVNSEWFRYLAMRCGLIRYRVVESSNKRYAISQKSNPKTSHEKADLVRLTASYTYMQVLYSKPACLASYDPPDHKATQHLHASAALGGKTCHPA